jgi:hypothetical protein
MRAWTTSALALSAIILAGNHVDAANAIVAITPAAPGAESGTVAALSTLDYFVGYDATGGVSKGAKCVESSEPLPQPAPSPQQTYFDSDQGSSFEQFFSTQNLSASVSFGYGGFDGDASFNLMSSSQMSRFSEYLRVTVNVENQRQLRDISKVKWTQYGNQAKKQQQVYALCGDGFVLGRITGGSLSIAYLATSKDSSEQQSTAATLNAAYSNFMAHARIGGSVALAFSQMAREGKLHVTILRKGANDALPELNPTDLINYALTYNAKVQTHPWITSYIIGSYDAVPDSPAVQEPEDPAVERRARVLRSMYQRLAGLTYMVKNSDQFGDFSTDKAKAEIQTLQHTIDNYRTKVNRLQYRTKSCNVPIGTTYEDVPDRPKILTIDPQFPGYIEAGTVIGNNHLVVENKGTWFYNVLQQGVFRVLGTTN